MRTCFALTNTSKVHTGTPPPTRPDSATLPSPLPRPPSGQPCPPPGPPHHPARPTTRPAPPCHQVCPIMLPGPARPARPPGLPRPATQATQPAPLSQPASTPPPPCLPRPANHPVQARLRRCFFDENFMFRGHAYAVCRWQKFGHHKGCRHVCSRIREVIISNLCL